MRRAELLQKQLKLRDLRESPPLERFREPVHRGPAHLLEAFSGLGRQLDMHDAAVLRAPLASDQPGRLELVEQARDVPGRDAEGLRKVLRGATPRSEERRVGKECRSRWS